MPRRPDSLDAYWLIARKGKELVPVVVDGDEDFPINRAGEYAVIHTVRLHPHSEFRWARVWLTDRLGFRYSRLVGFDEQVSQSEGALLLNVPLMRINRWVRSRKLVARKRRGTNGTQYSVVLVSDLLRIGKELGLPVRVGYEAVRSEDTDSRWEEEPSSDGLPP